MEPTKSVNAELKEIWEILGDGYGFNGSMEQGVEAIKPSIEKMLDAAFVAGRSKTTWAQFKKDQGL